MFGLSFIVALNIAARVDQGDVGGTLYRGQSVDEFQMVPVRGPGGAAGVQEPVLTTRLVLQEVQDDLNAYNLDRLRNWSIVAIVGLALASGAGGYVLSGIMLRPVREITDVASEISATNLSRRINYEGPDDELKALADTFDSMIARLEASFDRQRQFVADASHELRTPLTAIRTNIEVAEMDPDMQPEEYRALLETVKGQTARLTRLSEDLLLLTMNEGEEVATTAIDVTKVIREAARELGPVATARRVQLVVEGDEEAWGLANADMLYRCVLNLLDNGIKYSSDPRAEWDPNSKATATVTVRAAREAASVKITVHDTGPGIPEEARGQVFNRFYRVDKGRGRNEGGSGLGLAIVRELMEAQGGSASLEPSAEGGAQFVLVLARSAAPAWLPRDAVEV
ncbi:MAG: ATP-binding protein [Dehalococcoidia bacterium]